MNGKLLILFIIGPFFCFAQKQSTASEKINRFLDEWHRHAAEAEFENYFGKMAENAHYLGTDPTENWNKEEFQTFARPYFEKKKTWDFKAVRRNVFLENNGKFAYFNELLDTWMGLARGSGVLVKTEKGWKIKQYVLSFTIPNSISQSVVELKAAKDSVLRKKFSKK